MGRTKEQQREYMRAYRARQRAEHTVYDQMKAITGAAKSQGTIDAVEEARRVASEYLVLCNDLTRERDELREEVRHLKEELAKRLSSTKTHASAVLDAVERHGVNSPSLPHEIDRINHRFGAPRPAPKPGKRHG